MKSSIGDLKSQIPDLRLKALAILKINHLMRKDEGKGSQISDDFRSQIPDWTPGKI
jgi:hypothetical protein